MKTIKLTLRERNALDLIKGLQLQIYDRSGDYKFILRTESSKGEIVSDETTAEVTDEPK